MQNGNKSNMTGGPSAYWTSYSDAFQIKIVLDLCTGALTFFKDGVSQGVSTNVPLNQTYYVAASIGNDKTVFQLISYSFEP